MKNADKTAYPQVESCEEGRNGRYFFYSTEGLTKRERFAMAALESGMSPTNTHKVEETATWCVEQADALLRELEK